MASGLDPHIRDVFLRNDRDTWARWTRDEEIQY